MKWRPVHLIALILAVAAVVPLIAVSAGVFERGQGEDGPPESAYALPICYSETAEAIRIATSNAGAPPPSTPYPNEAGEPDKTAVWNHRPLCAEEAAHAVRIAAANADVLVAMGGDVDNGKVESVVRLMRGNERVGAHVYFTLTKPVDLARVMPELEVVTDAAAAADVAKGYKETQLRYKVTGLTKFRATVDLRVGRVVGFHVEDAETNVQSFPDEVPAD